MLQAVGNQPIVTWQASTAATDDAGRNHDAGIKVSIISPNAIAVTTTLATYIRVAFLPWVRLSIISDAKLAAGPAIRRTKAMPGDNPFLDKVRITEHPYQIVEFILIREFIIH